MKSNYHNTLDQIRVSAQDCLLNTITKNGGSIQLTTEQVRSFKFYSSVNGAEELFVGRLTDLDIFCPEEGQVWQDTDIMTDEADSPVVVTDIMSYDELDWFSLCELTDYINSLFDKATEYATQYKKVYEESLAQLKKQTFPINAVQSNLDIVQYIDVNDCDDIVGSQPMIFFEDYVIMNNWDMVEYKNIPKDDFAGMIDNLNKNNLLK